MVLYQPDGGYCFNSDSIFLYDFIAKLQPKGDLLDVGAGSGVLGLLLARDFPKLRVEGVEKQETFIWLAQHNAKINKIPYKLYQGDFTTVLFDKKYDFIISNPPFYPSKSQKSNNTMVYNARYNENLPMEQFFKKVSQLLKPHSHFVFCYDPTQLGDIIAMLDRVKMRVVTIRFVHPKKGKNASLVMIHARNGSKAFTNVLEPLFNFEETTPTQEVQMIYKKAQTQSIKCHI